MCPCDCCFLVFFFLMILRPPRSTRTDTLFPYTTLFRSAALSQFTMASPHNMASAPVLVQSPDRGGPAQPLLTVRNLVKHFAVRDPFWVRPRRSEEHTSELQSLMRISYAVFCLKKKKHTDHDPTRDMPRENRRHRSQ